MTIAIPLSANELHLIVHLEIVNKVCRADRRRNARCRRLSFAAVRNFHADTDNVSRVRCAVSLVFVFREVRRRYDRVVQSCRNFESFRIKVSIFIRNQRLVPDRSIVAQIHHEAMLGHGNTVDD